MCKLAVSAALALTLFVPGAASAQVFIGARLGYSAAGGDLYKGNPIRDSHTGMVPIQVDFGLDIAKALALGVYAGAGYTLLSNDVKDFCDAFALDCSGLNVRLGAQATLHAPVGQSKIWGGAMLGWEQQQYKLSGGGDTTDIAYRGVELGLQGGIDLPTSGEFRWGPFVGFSIGEYQSRRVSVTGNPPEPIEPVTDKSNHTWLTFGLRGVFGL